MAFAGLATFGYSEATHLDGSIALLVRGGWKSSNGTASSIATFGYGATNGAIKNCVRFGFLITSGASVPAGKQNITVSGLPWSANAYSILTGASPAVINGDVMQVDLLSTPGRYPVTVNSDGTFSVAVNGDTARQSFVADVYNSTLAVNQGLFTTWVNNSVPVQPNQADDLTAINGFQFGPIDLNNYIVDLDGDVITFTVTSTDTLPPGVTLNGSVLSGTPRRLGGFTPSIVATDATGDSSNLFPVSITVVTLDSDLQQLLDPLGNGSGIIIIDRLLAGSKISYFCRPDIKNPGRPKWVDVTASDQVEVKAATIQAALTIPAQPAFHPVYP